MRCDVEAIRAGRQMDEAIAYNLFRVTVEPTQGLDGEWALTMREPEFRTLCGLLPFYSTSMGAAWLVVERLRGMGVAWIGVMRDRGDTVWTVETYHPKSNDKILVHAETAPEAICRAALKAIEAPL